MSFSWHEADYGEYAALHDEMRAYACDSFQRRATYLGCRRSLQSRGELLPAGGPRVEDVKFFGAVALHHGVPERERIRHISTKVARLQQRWKKQEFVAFVSRGAWIQKNG